ncbi:MAG: hypothetical protein EOM20_07500 [Spartobacteria bacterium]|nr:hypothetical protein [Spartobacteria bacterium]
MKKLVPLCLLALVSMGLSLQAEPSALTWQQEAVTQIDLGEYDAAEKTAKLNRREDTTQAEIILMASGFKKWDDAQDKQGLVYGKTAYKKLTREVSMKDVPLLQELKALGGQQLTVFVNELIEEAVGRVKTVEDVNLALTALETLPPDQAPDVINSLGVWLAEKREEVNQGQTLSEETQAVFTNSVLIETLIDHVLTEPTTTDKAMGMLPAKIRRVLSSSTDTHDAADCLVFIEEPALPYVQEQLDRLGPKGVTLEQDIRIAISTREIRRPGATWCSGR